MRKRKSGKKWILIGAIILSLCCVLPMLPMADIADTIIQGRQEEREVASMELGWNLILVNDQYSIPEDYEPDLMQLSNGQQIDKKIYPALQEMFDTARAEGLGLYVAAGYRTDEKQTELIDKKICSYLLDGHSLAESRKMARQWVAVPGTSEHQMGIAVDINADVSISRSSAVYTWLQENAYRYGFIQRYPDDKVGITGISYEPWHYRYVGEAVALEMHEQNLCLEEYVERLKK